MVWTYAASPSTAPGATTQQLRDAVRLMCGDTDSTDPQLQDAEVDWFVGTESNPRMAAHAAALSLQGKYARQADLRLGTREGIMLSQQAEAYAKLAATLLDRASQDELAQMAPIPIAGGLTDWTQGNISPDVDAITGEQLPGSFFTRDAPRTMAYPAAAGEYPDATPEDEP